MKIYWMLSNFLIIVTKIFLGFTVKVLFYIQTLTWGRAKWIRKLLHSFLPTNNTGCTNNEFVLREEFFSKLDSSNFSIGNSTNKINQDSFLLFFTSLFISFREEVFFVLWNMQVLCIQINGMKFILNLFNSFFF